MQIRSFQRDGDVSDWRKTIIQQYFCHRAQRLRALLLIVAGGMLCAPLLLIATNAQAFDHAGGLIAKASSSALALLLLATMGGVAMWAGLRALLRPTLHDREIEINAGVVIVNERIGRRQRCWREPLAAYCGLRHRVITTSSGLAHNLVLEHPKRDRSVIIANAPHLELGVIATASEHFKLPVLTEVNGKTPNLSKSLTLLWAGMKARRRHLQQSAGT